MKKQKIKSGTLWMIIGGLLMSAAFFLSIYNIYEDKKAEESAKEVSVQLSEKMDESIE